jgi:hypothetical protein
VIQNFNCNFFVVTQLANWRIASQTSQFLGKISIQRMNSGREHGGMEM